VKKKGKVYYLFSNFRSDFSTHALLLGRWADSSREFLETHTLEDNQTRAFNRGVEAPLAPKANCAAIASKVDSKL